jgi:gliding motility-associated-like protein
MKHSYALLFIFFLFSGVLLGQTQIERSVLSAGGTESSSNSIKLSATVGESIVTTEQASGIVLTQGFHQSIENRTLSLFFRTFNASCVGRANGRAVIDSIKGCAEPYRINWVAGIIANDTMSVSGLNAGDYTIQVISNDGCQETFSFSIGNESSSNCILEFFSGITPNNDGVNDEWIIENVELYAKNKVNIYNRLGNKVFQGTNYNNNTVVWKGENLSGGELPSDTYFYIFEADGLVEKGWIELTR